jgi:hypothetical protein
MEADMKMLQQPDLTPAERTAAQASGDINYAIASQAPFEAAQLQIGRCGPSVTCALCCVQLRMEEKRIVSSTMDAVRARLAPIRGIPTKQGNLQDPNSVSLAGQARPVLLL